MKRLVRVSADPLRPEVNPSPLHMDLILDGSGRIADHGPIFGYEGSLSHKSSRCAPFVLYSDGTVDYGHEATDVHSATLDVRARPLQVGSPLLMIYNGDSRPYKIKAIVERLAEE